MAIRMKKICLSLLFVAISVAVIFLVIYYYNKTGTKSFDGTLIRNDFCNWCQI